MRVGGLARRGLSCRGGRCRSRGEEFEDLLGAEDAGPGVGSNHVDPLPRGTGLVAGEQVVANGRLTRVDEARLQAEVPEAVRRLGARLKLDRMVQLRWPVS